MNLSEIPIVQNVGVLTILSLLLGCPLIVIIAFYVEKKTKSFKTWVITIVTGTILLVVAAGLISNHFYHNLEKAESIATSNIQEIFNIDSEIKYNREDERIVSGETSYIDSKTDTKYEIEFRFRDDNKTPYILKNAVVTDTLVESLTK